MLAGAVTILGIAVVALGVMYFYPKYISPELHHIVSDITDTVTKLETFVAKKEVQIADHVEEIALANKNLQLKTADKDRAARIKDKLNELLA